MNTKMNEMKWTSIWNMLIQWLFNGLEVCVITISEMVSMLIDANNGNPSHPKNIITLEHNFMLDAFSDTVFIP